jgi:predicted transcriptional regulator
LISKSKDRRKKHRSRAEIVGAMLNAGLEGISKTKLMYLSYLSGSQLKQYLPLVLQKGLLEYDAKQMRYFTTMKGRAFLKKAEDLKV